MPRLLTPVPLASLAVGEALSRLARVLRGQGDALLPVPPRPAAAAPLDALRPGTALLEGEDDESDPTALVVATSGSTGEPKGALLPASALVASATATHDRLGGPGTWLLALAPHHVAGVQVLVRSVVAGTEPEVLDLHGGFDVRAFCAATQRLVVRTSGRRYTALVPTQLVRLLDAGPRAIEALASFDAVLLGGAATPPVLLRRSADAGVRVVTTYGMSETCGGCVYDGVPLTGVQVVLTPRAPRRPSPAGDADSDAARGDAPLTVVGRQARSSRTDSRRARDADGDVEGRIRLGGPVVARGYRCRRQAPEFETDGAVRWFATNDVGRWSVADGPGGGPHLAGTPGSRTTGSAGPGPRLVVLGRADDVIVTGGSKVAPQAVEEVISRLDGVLECLVVGVPDGEWGQRVVALVVPTGQHSALVPPLQVVREAVRASCGAPAAPHDVLPVDGLPVTSLGKPDRREAARRAERLLSGGSARDRA